MKKALIFDGQLIEIANTSFPVVEDMHWLDVEDDVSVETHKYNGFEFVLLPAIVLNYHELRIQAYPKISDQLDALWKGGEFEFTMKQTILAIKEKYPKQ